MLRLQVRDHMHHCVVPEGQCTKLLTQGPSHCREVVRDTVIFRTLVSQVYPADEKSKGILVLNVQFENFTGRFTSGLFQCWTKVLLNGLQATRIARAIGIDQ